MSPESSPYDESFASLHLVQERLARRGYLFQPIPREHTEGTVTTPLIHRVRGQIKRRGFEKVARKVTSPSLDTR